jgi:transposase
MASYGCLRTGAPWRDLAERYGPWQTVASRFYRWDQSGVWDRVWATLQAQADAGGALDWSVHYVDGTIIRAHQHAAGAKTGGPAAQALGRSQGGFSTKVHLRAEGAGKPMALVLTPGERHEAVVFPQLMEGGVVKRIGPGRPRCRPRRVVGDKGYSSRAIRHWAHRRGIRTTIPRKRNECRTGPFDRAIYRSRNRIERLVNRLKQFRRLATRYEKHAKHFQAMWIIGAILLWL